MTDESCVHGLTPDTCTTCKHAIGSKARQAELHFGSIREAVADLGARGDFRTKDVAAHPSVQQAHGSLCSDPQFAKQIGAYLTDAVGRLKIEQVSAKGRSNATWRARP